ncbi:phosphate signaling complex protein PhoU [Halosegnis marinus]|uniref:Phosphate-specific transport system accessory protein PhoU n=1 Tax=Halosegnis marinus TaxID=3034023 RepID=A0ABD5ZP35_9EURY|nr:phosphate signaling complex protein PhoU [Halosegnis sp. DT85]
MARETYQAALDRLRDDVLAMGDLVVDRYDDGLESLLAGDPALAESVVAGDDEVNARYLALESDCIDLLALQQPVAGDLRFVAASFKILTDLERVADLATNLGRYALAAEGSFRPEVAVGDIGATARDLLVRALDAYATGDPAACRAVVADDDDLDALCLHASETVTRELLEGRDDAWDLERVVDDVSRLLLTVRDLERVGDHAVNVAARTLYMAENDPELIR